MVNEQIITDRVTNLDYFFMIDNQVREAMKKIETEEFLSIAKRFLEKCNVTLDELRDFPIEGYYYETEELSLYSKILRNLQHNKDVIDKFVDCEELERLKQICNNDLFGLLDPRGRGGEGPIKRRYDILTRTMENMAVFPDQNDTPRPWTIDRIMQGLSTEYGNRANLVELAYLTGDPRCLCAGAESNSLYRMFACITGSYACSVPKVEYIWEVTPEVECLGKRLVDEYNKFLNKNTMVAPTVDNIWRWNRKPKIPRVALLGYVTATREYYHWILNDRFQLFEVYSPNIITTQTYEEGVRKQGIMEQLPINGEWFLYGSSYTGNIFNATP
jgi:hypothetical protein